MCGVCTCSHWTRTVFLRGSDEDYTMTTRARLLERLRVILAGRAAEEVRTVWRSHTAAVFMPNQMDTVL